MSAKYSYDDVPYPSYTFPQTSPDRLATMAILHGLKPASPDKCRVLEIGCGDGTNLLSFAYTTPESEFEGIDLSSVHIEKANSGASVLGLSNVKFAQIDLMEYDTAKSGRFDYILAHGLYSWVPVMVRKRVLAIFRSCLADDGIGYISYNAYPGCHVRKMFWEMMKFETRSEHDPLRKVAIARGFMKSLMESTASDNIHRPLLQHEYESLLDRNIENILHDDLAEINDPFYFYQFVDELEANGLTYLADADPLFLAERPEFDLDLPKSNPNAELSIALAQRRDFADFMRFRSSLFILPGKHVQIASVMPHEPLWIASQIEPVSSKANLQSTSEETFRGATSGEFKLNHPFTKTALGILRNAWPNSLKFNDLLAEATMSLDKDKLSEEDVARASSFFFQLFKNGFVKLHAKAFNFARSAGEHPKASDFARWQIASGNSIVTTMTGANVALNDDIIAQLISLLDGTRNRDELREELLRSEKVPFSSRHDFSKQLPDLIESNLAKFAKWGLLID